jgi:hypothetical protein
MLSRRQFAAALAASPPNKNDAFLDDLSRRTFLYFVEQADPLTGLVRDRALANAAAPDKRPWGSSAATGFGLTGLCIAAERGWLPKAEANAGTKTRSPPSTPASCWPA